MMELINVAVIHAERTSGYNFVRSLQVDAKYQSTFNIIGVSDHPTGCFISSANTLLYCPQLSDSSLSDLCSTIKKRTGNTVDIVYETRSGQHMIAASQEYANVPIFLPAPTVVEIAENKHLTFLHLKKNEFSVPETILIEREEDVDTAFLTIPSQTLWFRITKGKGSKGAFATSSPVEAKNRIGSVDGWGMFTAARRLPSNSSLDWNQRLSSTLYPGEMLTWSALFHKGTLVASQSRKRLYFEHTDLTVNELSFVGALMTFSCESLTRLGLKVASSFDKPAHGAIGLDVIVDHDGSLCITEIQLGRFFATTYHMAKIGLNFPKRFVEAFFGFVGPCDLIDPLPEGNVWIQRFGSAGIDVKRDQVLRLIQDGYLIC